MGQTPSLLTSQALVTRILEPRQTALTCLLPSHSSLGSCWSCRTPRTFRPEGECSHEREMSWYI